MAKEDLDSVIVVLCDWRGHIVWSSAQNDPPKVGDFVWSRLAPESRDPAKETLARVASLRQPQNLVVVHQNGKHYRCWLWPLDTPEIAVCVLGREVPGAVSELTDRELECLQFLAQGLPIRVIAEQMNLSTSTLHTHLSRAREKLNLDSLEALICFAARYCYPPTRPLIPNIAS
jgi:DNA-binding CsgD family transcriptional regulator